MGVVDDGDDVFAFAVEGAGFVNETFFASVVVAVAFESEGLAEESEHVVPGVEGAVDDGGDPLFGVVVDEGVFEDGFPGAGFAENETEAALLAVDFEDVEVALLVFEQWCLGTRGEWVGGDAEVRSDHDAVFGCWRLDFVGWLAFWRAVISEEVDGGGWTEPLVVVIDNGWLGGGAAVVTDGDLAVA